MLTWARASLLILALLTGCAHHGAASSDPASVLTAARAAPQPFALRAAYAVSIRRGEGTVSTRGALIVRAPDQFRVEVNGPVGTPLLIVASDGHALNVYNAQNSTFYRGADAPAALAELTGGALALSDVVRVLTGQIPMPSAEVQSTGVDDRGVAVTLKAPGEALVNAHLSPKTATLADLAVVMGGVSLVTLDYDKAVKVGRSRLPGGFDLSVPSLDLGVNIDIESWDELGQIPDVFTLKPPSGATEKDLIEALHEAAVKQGSRPQP